MGDIKGFENGDYHIRMILSSKEPIQIRDFALEAVRQSLHKDLAKIWQNKIYFIRCNVYPHNILRNNRIFSGGSKGERVQTGMKKSFGSPEGRAAIIKRGQPIFTAYFKEENKIAAVRTAFKKVTPKLACKAQLNVEFLDKALLKKIAEAKKVPKKIKEKKVVDEEE